MNRFVKHDIMEKATTVQKLNDIDVKDKNNHKSLKQINVGFFADQNIKCMLVEKKVSERAVMDFRSECLKFLVTMVKRMQTKSPFSYDLVRNLSCLDPRQIYEQHESNLDRFRRVRIVLTQSNTMNDNECDEIQTQYDLFVEKAQHLKTFREFSKEKDRVDKLVLIQ